MSAHGWDTKNTNEKLEILKSGIETVQSNLDILGLEFQKLIQKVNKLLADKNKA